MAAYVIQVPVRCVCVCVCGALVGLKRSKLPEGGVRTPKHVGAILMLILYSFYEHLLVK